MSASSNPTFAPVCANASARLTETVVLPTPPLPLATPMMFFTVGIISSMLSARPSITLAVTFRSSFKFPSVLTAFLTSSSI